MADPFSITASSFAVVGAADVVVRLSLECHRFLSEIKDAPEEIDRLRTSIKENRELVDTLMKHLADLRDPTSSISSSTIDLSPAINQTNSSVRALQRELNALLLLSKKYNGGNKTWERVKWVLDERKISKCLERLERTKSTLGVVLLLLEGRRSTTNQKKAQDIAQQNFDRIISTTDAQLQDLSMVREGQEKTILYLTRQLKQTDLIRKEVLKAGRINRMQHDKTRGEVTEGNQKILAAISSRFDNLRITIPRAKKSNREIHFIGPCREAILPPLLLIKDQVRRAVLSILSDDAEQVPSQQLNWLLSEFDNLVSSATQEAAALYQGSTATSFDQWDYSGKPIEFPDISLPVGDLILRDECMGKATSRALAEGSQETSHQKRLYSNYKVFSSKSSVGKLSIAVPHVPNTTNVIHSIEEVRLSFIPHVEICSTPIGARFIKSMSYGQEPRLYAQLNAFRQIRSGRSRTHYQLMTYGTLQDIDTAFRNGIISPYDLDGSGGNICFWFAVRSNRRDIFEYLESQGVGPSTLNGEKSIMQGFWATLQRIEDGEKSTEPLYRMLNFLENMMKRCTLPHLPYYLVVDGWTGRPPVTDEYVRLIRTWLKFLMRHGHDLNSTFAEDDATMILQHAQTNGERSLAIVRLLIELGADLHAVTSRALNAIHCAMFSNVPHHEHEDPEILEEKLSLLIGEGVDLHHRDQWGRTPSYLAKYECRCFTVWCRALERNGKQIEEVLREDGELEFLEDNSDYGKSRYCGAKDSDE